MNRGRHFFNKSMKPASEPNFSFSTAAGPTKIISSEMSESAGQLFQMNELAILGTNAVVEKDLHLDPPLERRLDFITAVLIPVY